MVKNYKHKLYVKNIFIGKCKQKYLINMSHYGLNLVLFPY